MDILLCFITSWSSPISDGEKGDEARRDVNNHGRGPGISPNGIARQPSMNDRMAQGAPGLGHPAPCNSIVVISYNPAADDGVDLHGRIFFHDTLEILKHRITVKSGFFGIIHPFSA